MPQVERMRKILLVEDEAQVVSFISKGLMENDYDVAVALDGAMAKSIFQNNKFDLIILDIMLPDTNGIELCKQFRKENSQVPILFLTALGTAENIVHGLEAGADDVITNDDGSIEVNTTPESFGQVLDAIDNAGLKYISAQVTMVASTDAAIDAEHAPTFMKLVDYLEDLDDVQEVYHNGELTEEAEAALG